MSVQLQATGGVGLDTVKRALLCSSKHTGLATTDLCVCVSLSAQTLNSQIYTEQQRKELGAQTRELLEGFPEGKALWPQAEHPFHIGCNHTGRRQRSSNRGRRRPEIYFQGERVRFSSLFSRC